MDLDAGRQLVSSAALLCRGVGHAAFGTMNVLSGPSATAADQSQQQTGDETGQSGVLASSARA